LHLFEEVKPVRIWRALFQNSVYSEKK